MSEREYIFTCILNELYKQTEYYNYYLPDFLSLTHRFSVYPPQGPPPSTEANGGRGAEEGGARGG